MLKMKDNKFFCWFRKMPIGNKITIMYAGVFAVILMIMSAFIILNAWYFYRDISRQELDETITKVSDYIKSGGKLDEDSIDKLNPNKYVDIRVTALRQKNKFEIMGEPEKYPPPDINLKEENDKFRKDRFELETIKGKRYMYDEKMIDYNNERYFIQVFRPYYHEQRIMKIFSFVFITVNILGILIAFGIGKFISKKLLKPVVDISQTAERISINDLSQRINIPVADDEIKELAVTFNDMISRLQISFDKQKQFISDASHELRTPISVIQGYANLMDRWGKSDPEILQESIDSIKDETEHMSMLVKKLLFLARGEKNMKDEQMKSLVLNNVISDVIKEINVMDIKNKIEFSEKSDLEIFGDYDLIKQMIWIFLENAVKYSSNESEIHILIYSENKNAVIEIKDNGIGIKQEDIPFIFDRFYRGDKSRSKETPGTGLGLSIASLIIKQHKGKVEVESEYQQGTTFKIFIPLNNKNEGSVKK